MQQRPISGAIGHTPLLRLSDSLYAKLESLNPSGSIKDRMAKYILDRAEERGELAPGATIIEATSGNTGIAFAMLAAERGYTMIVVMPSDMSEERKRLVRFFGAEIDEVGPGDFLGAVARANELAKETGAFRSDQFENLDNVRAHEMTTGAEIIEQVRALEGSPKVAAFIAGTGTGGTLMGVRAALLPIFPNVQTVAVEASESAVMSGGAAHPHLIQGISDGFIPAIVDMNVVDEVIVIPSEAAVKRTKRLATEQGLLVGISSGANVAAAEQYIERHHPEGIVVTVLPDRQERYASILS